MALSKPDDFNPEVKSPADEQQILADSAELSELSTYPLNSVEFSTQLENSVPLEAPRRIYRLPVQPAAISNPASVTPPLAENLTAGTQTPDLKHQQVELPIEHQVAPQPEHFTRPAEVIIPLLSERLVIDRYKRKIGEVVVRKEIETQTVEVQVRREKLIVEQVSPEYQQLAVVDLGLTQSDRINATETALPAKMEARFRSAQAAIYFLQALVIDSALDLREVQMSVVLSKPSEKPAQ